MEICVKCESTDMYYDGINYVCPMCGHETNKDMVETNDNVVRDCIGNELNDKDDIIVMKDLKVKGSSATLKIGTKVKNIRLVEGDHNIDCHIDGFGAMKLKSEFVKKI